jgi:hypothetical protein
MRWPLIALAGMLSLGCSSDSDEGGVDTLDCAWLEGDNCWKTTLAGATTCLPAEDDYGTLAADGSTCTYATGHIVTFDEPLVLPLPDEDVIFRFTLTAGGQTCVRYSETDSSMTVTVGDQVFEESSNGVDMRVTCPDGSSYSNDNALDLLECRGDFLSSLAIMPGYSLGSSDASVSFGFIGYSEEQSLAVFSCRR